MLVDYISQVNCGIVVIVIISLIILLCNVIVCQSFIDCIPCVLVDYHFTCMYVGVLMYYLQLAMAIPLVAIRVLHVCRVGCMLHIYQQSSCLDYGLDYGSHLCYSTATVSVAKTED